MMKESLELQAYCSNVKTFEESMECFRKAQEFEMKWQTAKSLQQHTYSPETYEQMQKEAAALETFCSNAKTFEQGLECMRQVEEFQSKWGAFMSL
jgi:cell fate (sporulation/competence/biofilm development) regulator YmcA (YheA/YmcA/DUF963 family)